MYKVLKYDNYRIYLKEIQKYPLLTVEEEYTLAVDYRENYNIEAVKKLVVSNLRYVVKVANKYKNYNLDVMDLIQEGNVGLMIAVKKFDPDYIGKDNKKIHLLKYASYWIKAYIYEFIIKSRSLLNICTTVQNKKLFFSLDTHEDLGMFEQKDIDIMRERLKGENSLNQNLFDSEETYIDILPDETPNQELKLIEHQSDSNIKTIVHSALSVFNERDAYIIEHRFLADDKKTLQVLSEELNISRERCRQLEEKCVKNLKKIISQHENYNEVFVY